MKRYIDNLLDHLLSIGDEMGYRKVGTSLRRQTREMVHYISQKREYVSARDRLINNRDRVIISVVIGVCYIPLNRLRGWPDFPPSAMRCHVQRRIEEFLPEPTSLTWEIQSEAEAEATASDEVKLLNRHVFPMLETVWTIEGLITAWNRPDGTVLHPLFETDRTRWLEQLQELLPLSPQRRLVRPTAVVRRDRKCYLEGDWILVPFDKGDGFAVGIIARVNLKGILAGFFFAPAVDAPPPVEQLQLMTPEEAVDIERFSDVGLLDDGWPIIWRSPNWGVERELWRLPDFGRVDSVDTSIGFRTTYDPDDPAVRIREVRCSADEARSLPHDSFSGHISLQIGLRMILAPDCQ